MTNVNTTNTNNISIADASRIDAFMTDFCATHDDVMKALGGDRDAIEKIETEIATQTNNANL